MSNLSTPKQPPFKVFGVGLGRTGTLSLCLALEKLGFGPCYHPLHVPKDKGRFIEWAKVLEGQTDREFLDSILDGFNSATDSPVAYVADAIINAYPDSKYILTTRDVDKWGESVTNTFYKPRLLAEEREQQGIATEEDRKILSGELMTKEQKIWVETSLRLYFNKRGLPRSPKEDPRPALVKHNEWIKEIIPQEQLLIFDVAEGWGTLAKFLGVPEPEEPFPQVNSREEFFNKVRRENGLLGNSAGPA